MKLETSVASEPAVEIRPGVFRPDWSVATSMAARRALHGRIAARAGLLDQWSHRLEAAKDTVWRTTLQLYGASGRVPSVSDIAVGSGILPSRVADILCKLQSHDLVALDQTSNRIRLAYPFTESVTGHRSNLTGMSCTRFAPSTRLASQTCMTPIPQSLRHVFIAVRRSARGQRTRAARCKASFP